MSRFVNDGASIRVCPLTHVIKLSPVQAVVSDVIKSARVVPLFKKRDKTEVGNYRLVYDQVGSYLDQKKLLYKFQSEFRNSFLFGRSF